MSTICEPLDLEVGCSMPTGWLASTLIGWLVAVAQSPSSGHCKSRLFLLTPTPLNAHAPSLNPHIMQNPEAAYDPKRSQCFAIPYPPPDDATWHGYPFINNVHFFADDRVAGFLKVRPRSRMLAMGIRGILPCRLAQTAWSGACHVPTEMI